MAPMFAYGFSQLERVKAELRRLRGDRQGVTAMEYGIIAAVTVAAVGGVLSTINTDLTAIWTSIDTALK